MKTLQHFILTRFNLGLYRNERKDKNKQRVNHHQWMDERFILFDQYCFPSLQAQLNQNFKWLVLFDANTPAKYRDIIKRYQKYANFVPLFSHASFLEPKHVEGYADFKSYILKHLEPGVSHLITTRIDNDDAFHVKAIQLIQNHVQATKSDYFAIEFPFGYCLHRDSLFIKHQPSNPFLSLVERIGRNRPDSPQTIMWAKHRLISNTAPMISLNTYPMWIQVIHERNLINRAGGQRVPFCLSRQDFVLNDPRLYRQRP